MRACSGSQRYTGCPPHCSANAVALIYPGRVNPEKHWGEGNGRRCLGDASFGTRFASCSHQRPPCLSALRSCGAVPTLASFSPVPPRATTRAGTDTAELMIRRAGLSKWKLARLQRPIPNPSCDAAPCGAISACGLWPRSERPDGGKVKAACGVAALLEAGRCGRNIRTCALNGKDVRALASDDGAGSHARAETSQASPRWGGIVFGSVVETYSRKKPRGFQTGGS